MHPDIYSVVSTLEFSTQTFNHRIFPINSSTINLKSPGWHLCLTNSLAPTPNFLILAGSWLKSSNFFQIIAYIFLKKSSLTQNAHFLRQKRLGKHYVTLFKMGSIPFWITIFKLFVPFGKSFIVLKFFLTNDID